MSPPISTLIPTIVRVLLRRSLRLAHVLGSYTASRKLGKPTGLQAQSHENDWGRGVRCLCPSDPLRSMNTGEQIPVQILAFISSGYMHRSGIIAWSGNSMFNFFEESPCNCPQWGHYFTSQQQRTIVSTSPHPHQHLCFVSLVVAMLMVWSSFNLYFP